MDTADAGRAPIRGVRGDEGLHVRKGEPGRLVFGALPREAWAALGILELVCTIGLLVPAAVHWHPQLTGLAAALLAIESFVFIWVHVRYRETTPVILSAVLGFSWRLSLSAAWFSGRSSDLRPTGRDVRYGAISCLAGCSPS
mgnify:CR=1 FL=1